MGLGKLIGLDDLIAEVGTTVRQVLPNKAAERDFQLKLEELRDKYNARMHEEILGQIEVNKVEAAHASIFVAGWRPFIGWSCGAGVAYAVFLGPMLTVFGLKTTTLDTATLLTLVGTILGSSGFRTFEKMKGLSRENFAKPELLLTSEMEMPVADEIEEVPTEEEKAPWTR